MMMTRKIVSAAVLLLAGMVSLCANAKEVKLAPGAACFVWNEDTPVMPKSVPVGGFVDNGIGFNAENTRGKIDGLSHRFFAVWEGYVKIPKAGNYAFVLTTEDNVNAEVFINRKSVLKRLRGPRVPNTMTGNISLPGGMTHVRIFFNGGNSYLARSFTLKFGLATGMKRTDIVPSKMYHEPEDEE